MKHPYARLAVLGSLLLVACGGPREESAPREAPRESPPAAPEPSDGEELEIVEHPLGTIEVGGLPVQLTQVGGIAPGKAAYMMVRLPESDRGASVVRAWIGTEERTLSYVGKGAYARSHDDHDLKVFAPDPLPAGARWWIEIETPDGALLLGSAEPILAE